MKRIFQLTLILALALSRAPADAQTAAGGSAAPAVSAGGAIGATSVSTTGGSGAPRRMPRRTPAEFHRAP